MGAALVAGLLKSGMPAESVSILEKVDSRRRQLAGLVPGVSVSDAPPEAAEAVILAVKPAQAEEASLIAKQVAPRRVLSIMAGVRIRAVQFWVGPEAAILRAMPNTPALVGAGASAVAGGPSATEEDFAWALRTLGHLGEVVRVEEDLLDAVTGLSGSGPAYVFLATEALTQAGIEAGLPPEIATVLARQTVIGAGQLLAESNDAPEVLRAQVTSPGGTTAAGIEALRSAGFEEALAAAVKAATDRATEMGEELAAGLPAGPQT
jgi:pyrroline-5-carboxylate reductase